jgi:rhomboid protease GluP
MVLIGQVGHIDDILSLYSVHGPSIRDGQIFRVLTGTLLHGGIMHLFFNMYSLYVLGSQLEGFFGKFKFILIYLFSAICGSFLSITFGQGAHSVGASGAIFGLMGSLLYFGYYYRVYLGQVVKSQILPLIIVNLIVGATMPNIDNWAHIGGLIGGGFDQIYNLYKHQKSQIWIRYC